MELKQLIMNRPAWLTSSETGSGEQIILSTELSLQRNFDKFPFPSKASVHQKKEVFASVNEVITSRGILGENPLSINLTEVSDIAKTLLFERDYLPLHTIHTSGDRGVVVAEDGTILLVNSDNHLKISKFCTSETVQTAFEELNTADTLIGKELTYAYSEDIGFLQNRPDMSGSGFAVSYTLHLPGLVHTGEIEQVLSGAAQMGMNGGGKFRLSSESWGALFTLTSTHFMGTVESEILADSTKVIEEIVQHEKDARTKIFDEAALEIEDKVWRSLGVLKYCRLLSVAQLVNLTSTIRLGLDRGVEVEELTHANIDSMIASSLQGSVALLMDGEVTDGNSLDVQRAEIVRTMVAK